VVGKWVEGTSDDLQIRCSIITTALRKHFARFVYRLGHCPFTAGRRGSIPPPSTIFNYIGLPKPVGDLGEDNHLTKWLSLGYTKDGNEVEFYRDVE
jgi:hypothetical protein